MFRPSRHLAIAALTALTLTGGLAACGDDDEQASTPPPAASTPPPAAADMPLAIDKSTPRAKVRLVVDIIAASDQPKGIVVTPREDFGISSAISGTAAAKDDGLLAGIDLLQKNPPKGSFTVPFGGKTRIIDQGADKATKLTRAAFLSSLKSGPRLVVISWAGSAAKAKSAEALLAEAPIEVRTVPNKA